MTSLARKTVIPSLSLTELAEQNETSAIQVQTADNKHYFVKPKQLNTSVLADRETQSKYRLFPLVLSGDGSPWAEANLYILSLLDRLEKPKTPGVRIVVASSDRLKAYRGRAREMG